MNEFVVSHPTGNTFVRALLEELYQRELLSSYFTTLGAGKKSNAWLKKLFSRRLYNIPDKKIRRYWLPEIFRLLEGGNQEKKRKSADNIYKLLDLKVSSNLCNLQVNILHSYEDGSFESFQKAKKLGIRCSYELPIAHWRTVRSLLSKEAERYPEWEPTLESTRESEDKLFRKEEELRLADRITCPSNFVLDSIPNEIKDTKPCQISPFGSPRFQLPKKALARKDRSQLRLLFVGSMSQRKGLADLFEAMKLLHGEPVELTILGQPSLPLEFYRQKLSTFKYIPPCSNLEVRKIMQLHDALIIPSVIEGRALVQQEALACGIPVIATRNAGGEDLIEEGLTGYLIPVNSPEKIAEKVLLLFDKRDYLADMRQVCYRKAREYSWHNYAKKIIDFNLYESKKDECD